MWKKIISCLFLFFFFVSISNDTPTLTGCIGCNESSWGYTFGDFNRYNITANYITPSGIAYDPSGQLINPKLIDRLTDEVDACLADTFPGGQLPTNVVYHSYCPHNPIALPIGRSTFVVKIAPDWTISGPGCWTPQWGDQQLLPVSCPDSACTDKGLTVTDKCPCMWRAGIECPNNLIVTPSFYLYKDVLIRWATGCVNPWGTSEMAACARPTTDQLSDGTEQ